MQKELSTRPEEKYIGTVESWEKSENILSNACHKAGKEYKLNPGDGAFYGPKLDFHIKDSLGRIWQCGTIQLDSNLPERFDLTYVDSDGQKKRPFMLHRTIFGSMERFMGILIEHYAGAFPTWLSPVQINVIPVNNEYHLEYSTDLYNMLKDNGFRVELDSREEKLGYKMRESQTNKIPYTLIIGDNELNSSTISYRTYGSNETINIKINDFILKLKEEESNKR